MNSVSKNVCVDKIGNIVYKHNNTYHSTIKMQHFDIKSSTHVDTLIKNNSLNHKVNNMINLFLKYLCDNMPGNISLSSVRLDQQLPRMSL